VSDSEDEFDDEFEESFDEAFEEDFESVEESSDGFDLPSLREVGESVGEAVLDGVGQASARLQERRPLAADVLESDDAYLVVLDAPGAEHEDVQVRYEGNVVAVRVDRFRDLQEGFEMRVPGRGLSLSGEVDLPEGAHVDVEAAEATLTDNGTVRVRVPKRAPETVDEDRSDMADEHDAPTEEDHSGDDPADE
jgi:HSP20 family molecular chaperone IbpA